jgi:hypothetical protein
MRKVLWLIVCLMTMVTSANAHNVHYPTYTEDGITYVKNGTSTYDKEFGGYCEPWSVQKVNKPNDKTIIIPHAIMINGEKIRIDGIRENAFVSCVSLDSLIISDGMYLGEESFIGCKELEYLYYSSPTSAWTSRNKYTSYPNLSCKTLETTCGVLEDTFWKSVENKLEKLIIREASTGIFERIYDCKKLKTIICYAVNPPSPSNTYSIYSYGGTCGHEKIAPYQWETITLYVPRESLEKYYFHRVWGEIDNIYAIDEMTKMSGVTTSISHTTNNTSTSDAWYTINGTKVDNPTKGVYIKDGKKIYYK